MTMVAPSPPLHNERNILSRAGSGYPWDTPKVLKVNAHSLNSEKDDELQVVAEINCVSAAADPGGGGGGAQGARAPPAVPQITIKRAAV